MHINGGVFKYNPQIKKEEFDSNWGKIDWTNNKKDEREAETPSEPFIDLNI